MILSYIEDNFTPERAKYLHDSLDLLAKFNLTETEANLEDIAFHRDDLDTAGRIANINSIINEELISILNAHDILVLDLTEDLVLIFNMVDTIKKASEEYDANFILNRINFELSEANEAVDIFATLVELLTDSRADDVLENIYSMENDIVINLFSLLESKKAVNTQLNENGPIIDRYKQFLHGRRFGLVYELIKSNIEIGAHDFNSLWVLLEEGLTQLNHEDTVFELVSLMLISDAEPDELPALFEKTSRLYGQTEAEGKLILSDLKAEYTKYSGQSL